MKRYISLACVALIVVMCMVEPVSAAETQSVGYIDLLTTDILYYDGSVVYDSKVQLTPGSHTIAFPNNTNHLLGKFEFLIWSQYSDLTFTCPGGAVTKVSSALGLSYYVISGDFSGGAPTFYIDSPSGGFLNFCTGKAMILGYHTVEVPFDFQVYDASDGELLVDQKAITRYEYEDTPYFTDIENYYYRQIRIYPDKSVLAGLDYFDLDFYVQNLEIDSISASFGGNALDVSYTSSFIGDGVINDSVSSGEVGQDKTYGIYKVVVRVDVSGINLVDGLPTVFITYNANNYYGYEPYVYIYGINAGSYYIENDPVIFNLRVLFSDLFSRLSSHFSNLNTWIDSQTSAIEEQFNLYFTNLHSWMNQHYSNLNVWILNQTSAFQSKITELETRIDLNFSYLDQWIKDQTATLEAAIRGDTAPGDSFQQEVDEKDQQLDDMAAVMDSVDRPELDSVNVDVSSYVSQSDIVLATAPLSALLEGELFTIMVMMSLTFSLAGYVLFGKR